MTIPLETVSAAGDHIDVLALQRNLDLLSSVLIDPSNIAPGEFLQLATTGTARKIAMGTVTFTFTGGTTIIPGAVAHGLGVVPQVVIIADWFKNGVADGTSHVDQASISSTTFSYFSRSSSAWTGSVTTFWIAIG